MVANVTATAMTITCSCSHPCYRQAGHGLSIESGTTVLKCELERKQACMARCHSPRGSDPGSLGFPDTVNQQIDIIFQKALASDIQFRRFFNELYRVPVKPRAINLFNECRKKILAFSYFAVF